MHHSLLRPTGVKVPKICDGTQGEYPDGSGHVGGTATG